jgi:hypothetical protein
VSLTFCDQGISREVKMTRMRMHVLPLVLSLLIAAFTLETLDRVLHLFHLLLCERITVS